MNLLAFDPGKTTGVAVIAIETGKILHWTQSRDLLDLWHNASPKADLVVAEAYVGSGPRDEFSVLTIERIGQIKLLCRMSNKKLVMRTNQQRRAFLRQATDLLPKATQNKHAVDALAHAMAYRRVILEERTNARRS